MPRLKKRAKKISTALDLKKSIPIYVTNNFLEKVQA
jgi:hypothetical protein